MAARIEQAPRTHAWVVLEDAGSVRGYAYAGPFRTRAAYRFCAEVSVYLAPSHRGAGGGRVLYGALLERLRDRGYVTAVAGMTLPNDASMALHRAVGFTDVGTYRRVGWKLGMWHDVHWMQRVLTDGDAPPRELPFG